MTADDELNRLREENVVLKEQVKVLEETVQHLKEQAQILQERLAKDSHNSHLPIVLRVKRRPGASGNAAARSLADKWDIKGIN